MVSGLHAVVEVPGHGPEDPGGRLLAARFRVHCKVRAVATVAMAIGAFVARDVLGVPDVDLPAFMGLAVAIGAYDAVAWLTVRRRERGDTPPDYQAMVRVNITMVVLDFLALTAAIWLAGGCRSPFAGLYLVHIIVGTVLLPRGMALGLLAIGYGLLALLVLGEWSGIAPPHVPVGLVASAAPLDTRFALTVLLVYGTLFGITSGLMLGLTDVLRRDQQRIAIVNEQLRRVSEQRRDFLHIAMHNLKAPIGAVRMFVDNVRAGLAGPVNADQDKWLGRSIDRLDGLTAFMAEMHALSLLETEIIESTFKRVDLGDMLQALVEDYRDVARRKNHELRVELDRHAPPVVGHRRLLREAVLNYVTNAIKYTPEGGTIVVRLSHRQALVRIEVTDDGEGIAEADLEKLFSEFERLRKRGSAATREKGMGLGLSLAKRVVEVHRGRVGVDSEPGRGSTFFIELPALVE